MAIDSSIARATPLLAAESMSVVRGGKSILNAVSLSLSPHELVGLVGPNGAGKSTLLSGLAGLIRLDSGQVSLKGKPIESYSGSDRAKLLGWMEQLASAHWPVSAEHLVLLGRIPYLSRWQSVSKTDRQLVAEMMRATDCYGLKDQAVSTLSGGELNRVLLARVLASEPSVLLADEPTAALDIGHQLQTMELLREFCTKGRGCIVVLHDLSLAARYCDRLVLLHEAQVVANGAPLDVLSERNVHDVYGVELAVFDGEVPTLVPMRRSL